jgi:hypothetical protein
MSIDEEIGTTGVFKRISNTYATDAGSDIASQLQRRKTENYRSLGDGEEFIMQDEGTYKRSL